MEQVTERLTEGFHIFYIRQTAELGDVKELAQRELEERLPDWQLNQRRWELEGAKPPFLAVLTKQQQAVVVSIEYHDEDVDTEGICSLDAVVQRVVDTALH